MKIIPHEEHAVAAPGYHSQFSSRVTDVPLGVGLSTNVDDLYDEIQGYANVLLGREVPPVDSPYLQLMELAAAYYGRAMEIDMIIHNEERKLNVVRGAPLYKFRTGSLRSFIEMTKRLHELGSRRLAEEQFIAQERMDAGI